MGGNASAPSEERQRAVAAGAAQRHLAEENERLRREIEAHARRMIRLTRDLNLVSSRKPWRTGIERKIASSRSWSAAFCDGSAQLEQVAAGLDTVDVGEIADVAADLRGQVGLDVFGPAFLQQGIGMVFVGDGEFEAVDDFAHAGRLLGGPIDDHGLVGRGDLAGQGDHAVGRAHLDGQLGRHAAAVRASPRRGASGPESRARPARPPPARASDARARRPEQVLAAWRGAGPSGPAAAGMGTGGGGGLIGVRARRGMTSSWLKTPVTPGTLRAASMISRAACSLTRDPAQEHLTRHIDADVNLPLDRIDLERLPALPWERRWDAAALAGGRVRRSPSGLDHRARLSSSRPPRGETHERRNKAEERVVQPAEERRGINIRRRRRLCPERPAESAPHDGRGRLRDDVGRARVDHEIITERERRRRSPAGRPCRAPAWSRLSPPARPCPFATSP